MRSGKKYSIVWAPSGNRELIFTAMAAPSTMAVCCSTIHGLGGLQRPCTDYKGQTARRTGSTAGESKKSSTTS